jgi:Group II intron, maturase-specific domain
MVQIRKPILLFDLTFHIHQRAQLLMMTITFPHSNYFRLGSVSKAYESVDSHVRNQLRQWLRRKHKIRVRVENHFTDTYLYQQLGVIRLTHFQINLPWAKAK